jgi:endonuclease YncB( thermonuclease family)
MIFKIKAFTRLVASYLILAAGLASGATITGKVVGVSDGDTITVLDASKTNTRFASLGLTHQRKPSPSATAQKSIYQIRSLANMWKCYPIKLISTGVLSARS